MKLLLILYLANMLPFTQGFASIQATTKCTTFTTHIRAGTQAETDAERLLRRARELREASQRAEDNLHATLIQKKKEKDSAIDLIISQLFPASSIDNLVDRLREKRLALETCVSVVERLHEREIAARGLEHVEPSLHHDQVTFKRVAQPDVEELSKIEGIVHDFIEAAGILDQEFVNKKLKADGGKITHAEMIHWGGGNVAGILKDKLSSLGRAQDVQFKKRLQSFYDAANRKNRKGDVDGNSWRDDDVWNK